MTDLGVTLVGRVDERSALNRWLGDALGGTPRVLMISGEPGMGKTALLRWLAAQAVAAGADVGWGAALDGVDVPFLAASSMLAELPGGAEALAGHELADGAWGGGGSHQLVAAVEAIGAATARRPLVLVMDDLQWADEASATLAHHLAIRMGTTRRHLPLLFAVAVREGHVDGPGSQTARRIAREQTVRQLHVGPLHEVEVRELHRSVAGAYPSATELIDVMETTGGRPILVAAHAGTTGSGAVAVRAGADPLDLLSGRIGHLPSATHRALEILAVVGERTPRSALVPLLGPDAEDAVRPAVEERVLRERDDDVVFEHSLYRQAALHALGPSARREISHRVAAEIVAEPLRSAFGVSVVARHLRSAPEAAPPAVVAEIRWQAGLDAYAAGAWGQAADHLVAALEAAEPAGTIWNDVARRWYRAGEAAHRNFDLRCVELLRTALSLADAETDPDLVAEATVLLARAAITLGGEPSFAREEEAAAVALAQDPDPRLDRWRAALYGVAAECHSNVYDVDGAMKWAAEARAARARTDDDALSAGWAVEMSEGLQFMAGLQLDDAAACFDRAVAITTAAGSPWHEASSRFRTDLIALMRGAVVGVEGSTGASMEVARSCHHWSECSFGSALRTVVYAARGDPRVESEAEAGIAMYRRTDYVFTPPVLHPALAYARAIRGDLDGADDVLAELEALGNRTGAYRRSVRRLRNMMSGVDDGGAPERSDRSRRRSRLDLGSVTGLAAAAELEADRVLGDAGGDEDTAVLRGLADDLDRAVATGLVLTPSWPYFLPRIRAHVAAALGDPDAPGLLDLAEEMATRDGLEFELVQVDLLRSGLAEEPTDAAHHASAAMRRADRSGLLTGVAAGQRRLRQLGAPDRQPMARVVVNTDIVSSTELTRSLGDEAWLSVLDEHDDLVRSWVRRNGGVVFKHTGDGIFAWFVSAADAVSATESLLAEFHSRRFHQGRVALQIRAGVSLGSPMSRDDGDLFGMTVIEAARLCSAAPDGAGLLSAPVAVAANRTSDMYGSLSMKGLGEPVDTYRLGPPA